MKKEVKCAICGNKIVIETENIGLTRVKLESAVCVKCERLRCPLCGDTAVIKYSNYGVPIEFRCLNPGCKVRKKILI